MSLQIEVRYLMINWQSEGVARDIKAAPHALEIERDASGKLSVESTVFNDFHPWLGIRLESALDNTIPVFVSASGEETPMLRIADQQGCGQWWLQHDGWDPLNKRHFSELHRSAGAYFIRLGNLRLRIENRLSSFGRADIQAYINDFRGDLLWMIMNDAAAATASGQGPGSGAELAVALKALNAASNRVLASPAVDIREGQAPQSIAKLRPNAATFHEYLRNPAARYFTGRVFNESADIPENRYVRQLSSDQDDTIWESRSFCIGCGERHDNQSIKAKRTKSGAMRWLLDCRHCGVWTTRTHCYSCPTPLFKNGTVWTYHTTIADQVTNVICPSCGAYFDKDFE